MQDSRRIVPPLAASHKPAGRVPAWVPRGAVVPEGNAEKARALLALLEGQGGTGGMPEIAPSRLRDWARDLIETVERAPVPTAASAPANPSPATAAQRSDAPTGDRIEGAKPETPRLFSRPAPMLRELTPERPEGPSDVGLSGVPLQLTPADRIPEVAAVAPKAPVEAARTPVVAVPRRADVYRMIELAINPVTIANEHPAVIAMTLIGKPSLEQARVLRGMPGGHVRAVHRALREMEPSVAG